MNKMQRTERMTALIQSCAKWREPYKQSISAKGCPLCVLYAWQTKRCNGCPISDATGVGHCEMTPYVDYEESDCTNDTLRLKEYQFLRGLWKKEKAKCQIQSN